MAVPVALSMIVRNEEANLPGCLDSVADLVAEIVVADTGSTDRTKEVAARYGARVVDFPWRDDFAAARNASLEGVGCPWVFWMDADDRLDEDNRRRLRALFPGLGEKNVGYQMKCVSPREPGTDKATVTDHLRVFRNLPQIRWEGRVHEQIRAAVLRSGGELCWSDVVVHHRGYEDAAVRARKADRNLRLLQLQNAEEPDNPFVLFNLGRSYHVLGRKREAAPYWQRSLRLSPRDAPYLARLYALLVETLYDENRLYEGLELCRQGLALFPEDAELLFHEASLMIETGDVHNAESRLLRWLGMPLPSEVAMQDRLLPSKARHNLAFVYMRLGRPAEAEAQLRAALAAQPDYRAAWQGLGQLWLGQGRLAEAAEAARQLAAGSATALDGFLLSAKVESARGNPAGARAALEEAVRREPSNPQLLLLLGRTLMQECPDWGAAEATFRRLLEMAPGHTEAIQRLDAIQSHRQTHAPGRATTEVLLCPACRGSEHDVLVSQGTPGWLVCKRCGRVFTAVRPL